MHFDTGSDPEGQYHIYIAVDNIKAPGSYPIDDNPGYNCQILKRRNDGSTDSLWGTFGGGRGTLMINSMDTMSRRISGNFSVTVVPLDSNTTLPLTISDGAFDNLYYE